MYGVAPPPGGPAVTTPGVPMSSTRPSDGSSSSPPPCPDPLSSPVPRSTAVPPLDISPPPTSPVSASVSCSGSKRSRSVSRSSLMSGLLSRRRLRRPVERGPTDVARRSAGRAGPIAEAEPPTARTRIGASRGAEATDEGGRPDPRCYHRAHARSRRKVPLQGGNRPPRELGGGARNPRQRGGPPDRRHHEPALRFRGVHARAEPPGHARAPRRDDARRPPDGRPRGLRRGRRGPHPL